MRQKRRGGSWEGDHSYIVTGRIEENFSTRHNTNLCSDTSATTFLIFQFYTPHSFNHLHSVSPPYHFATYYTFLLCYLVFHFFFSKKKTLQK